jgi:hypothetical protein
VDERFIKRGPSPLLLVLLAVLIALVGLALGALGTLGAVFLFRPPDHPDGIAALAADWTITYTNGAVRFYTIRPDGAVSSRDPLLWGRIHDEGGMMLLTFDGDDKLERLTLGGDGRLFVEHYAPKDDFPLKKPLWIGIGVRQP